MDGASFHAQDPTLFSYGNNGIAWETSKANEKKKEDDEGQGSRKIHRGKKRKPSTQENIYRRLYTNHLFFALTSTPHTRCCIMMMRMMFRLPSTPNSADLGMRDMSDLSLQSDVVISKLAHLCIVDTDDLGFF